MANTPAVIEHIPAYLVKYQREGFNDRFKVPTGEPIGRISIEGKVFTFIFQDDREIVKSAQDHPMPFLDICIVDANDSTSKAFWINGFVHGSTDAPDCSSILGDKPDPGSPSKQSPTCRSCKWDQFNTAEQGKGKRCGDSKRLAVLPAWDFENKDWGGPMLLRIPPTSFKDFGKYWKEQESLGRDLNLIITRIRFDPQTPHPKLFFNFQRWIDETEAPLMEAHAESEHIKRVLMVTQAELSGIDDPGEPEAAEPPQRAAAESDAAQKIAARRQAPEPAPQPQRRTSPAPQPAQAPPAQRPNGPVRRAPPVQEAPEEEVTMPAKRPTGNVTPMRQPAKGTATPVPRAAPPAETATDEVARKKAALAALIAQAEQLNAEINTPAEPNGVVVDGGYAEDYSGEAEAGPGEASTSDLLAAIDADELAGIPD